MSLFFASNWQSAPKAAVGRKEFLMIVVYAAVIVAYTAVVGPITLFGC